MFVVFVVCVCLLCLLSVCDCCVLCVMCVCVCVCLCVAGVGLVCCATDVLTLVCLCIKVLPTHAHIHNHIKHSLYSTVFNASHYGEDMQRALATLVYKNIRCKSSPYTAHTTITSNMFFIQLSLMLSGYPASSLPAARVRVPGGSPFSQLQRREKDFFFAPRC